MGGADKATLRVGGTALLDRVLAAARPVCDRLVVVGPVRPTGVAGVGFVSEAEPGGGPVPAVLAGVAASPGCDIVLVMATDLPLLATDHLLRLVAALDRSGADAAAAADRGGPNPLLAAYRVPGLVARAAGLGPGSPAGRLLPGAPATVDLGPATLNVNRPADLAAAELFVTHAGTVVAAAHWLRDLVTATVPGAAESVDGRRAFRYRHPQVGDFCAIVLGRADVRLVLRHPARTVDVAGPGQPPAALLVELIEAALPNR